MRSLFRLYSYHVLYFISCEDAKKLELFGYSFQKMNTYRGDFDKTKHMSFMIKDEKYSESWKNVSNITNKEFDSKPLSYITEIL